MPDHLSAVHMVAAVNTMSDEHRQILLDAACENVALRAERDRLREALTLIKRDSGTSTLTWKIAHAAIAEAVAEERERIMIALNPEEKDVESS